MGFVPHRPFQIENNMKKSKFSKLLNSEGKNILFTDGEVSRIGRVVEVGGTDTVVVEIDEREKREVKRPDVIGKVKRHSWFPMDRMPPENKQLLLEHKDGSIRMGKLLGPDAAEFYEVDRTHFHDPYWHRPFPMSDFTHWCIVQGRKP